MSAPLLLGAHKINTDTAGLTSAVGPQPTHAHNPVTTRVEQAINQDGLGYLFGDISGGFAQTTGEQTAPEAKPAHGPAGGTIDATKTKARALAQSTPVAAGQYWTKLKHAFGVK